MTSIDDLINAPVTPTVVESEVVAQVGGTVIETKESNEPDNDPGSSASGTADPVSSEGPSLNPAPEHTLGLQETSVSLVEASTDAILDSLLARIGVVEDTIPPFRMVLYGGPGVGKTVLACAAPGPLLVNIEKGDRSLRNHPQLKGVRILEFVSVYQLEMLIAKIAEGVVPGLTDATGTLVVDSGTELQKRDLDDIINREHSQDSARDMYVPTWPDINANTEHMRRLFASMRDLPCNIIITAHVREVKDEKRGTLLIRPDFTDKLAKTINHLVDTVGYLDLDNDVRTLQVHPGGNIAAKTRIGGLPAVIANPRMHDLVLANQATPVTPTN